MRAALVALSLLLPTAALAEPGCTMSREQFSQLKTGMFISMVNNKLGCEGELVGEIGDRFDRTKAYDYPAADGRGSMRLVFRNRELVAKRSPDF